MKAAVDFTQEFVCYYPLNKICNNEISSLFHKTAA